MTRPILTDVDVSVGDEIGAVCAKDGGGKKLLLAASAAIGTGVSGSRRSDTPRSAFSCVEREAGTVSAKDLLLKIMLLLLLLPIKSELR